MNAIISSTDISLPFLHGVTSNGEGGGCLLEGEGRTEHTGGDVDNVRP